jgi:NAD-dependent deacetylase
MLTKIAALTDDVRRVCVLTGAGVSTDSGIPDYRGPDGIWTKDPELAEAFTLTKYRADTELRARFWQTYADHSAWEAEPNLAHRCLADLERAGSPLRILTQNVDGLHQRAGSTHRKVLELHGNLRQVSCLSCAWTGPSEAVIARVKAGTADPRCPHCSGIIKLDVIMFGEHLDPGVFSLAKRIVAASHIMLAVGSSLMVEPVASLCRDAVDCGVDLIIVNRDQTPYDRLAKAVFREPIAEVLPHFTNQLANQLR